MIFLLFVLVLVDAAPLPVEVQEKFETVTGGKLVEGYGLTESSPVTHSNFYGKSECQVALEFRGQIQKQSLCHLRLVRHYRQEK